MSQIPVPFEGTESIDFYRAENLTLKIENNKLEQENVTLRHNLQLALTKSGSLGLAKQRITLYKPRSIVAERTWISDPFMQAQAASMNSSVVFDSMERQMQEQKAQLHQLATEKSKLSERNQALQAEIDNMRDEVNKRGAAAGAATTVTTSSYLQSQISFLHCEVERLEELTRVTQDEAVARVRAADAECQRSLQEKEGQLKVLEDELVRLRVAAGIPKRGKLDGEDMLTRCRMMETQLASALAEKNALHIENGELNGRIRKMEATLREKRGVLVELQKSAANETQNTQEHAQRLSILLAASNDERSRVAQELEDALVRINKPKAASYAQTDPTPTSDALAQTNPPAVVADGTCQVDTIGHFADPATQSVQSLRHALEAKCAEADAVRVNLDQLTAVHKETLTFLETTKSRLVDERNRRNQLEADVEGLSLELRSMQQQISQQAALDREKDAVVYQAQSMQQDAQSRLIQGEEAYRALEREVVSQRKDLQMLVASQNVHHQQVNEVNRQNAVLQEEIQKLRVALEHDKYMIQAKDAELRDVITSYQMLAKESDVLGANREVLEKENETLRQNIRTLEERNVMCHEQIAQLHAREQQLSLDLQSFDHEVGQLHRRLQHAQTREAELEAAANGHLQTIRALELSCDELRRNLAELSKQIVIRDNESVLLRSRCDALEKEVHMISNTSRNEQRRLRELEESNAQLMVRHILSSGPGGSQSHSSLYQQDASSADAVAAAQKQILKLQEALSRSNASLADVNQALSDERSQNDALHQKAAQLEHQLQDTIAVKDRLERLALDQASTLSRLSK